MLVLCPMLENACWLWIELNQGTTRNKVQALLHRNHKERPPIVFSLVMLTPPKKTELTRSRDLADGLPSISR